MVKLNKLESTIPKDAKGPILIKFGPVVLEKMIENNDDNENDEKRKHFNHKSSFDVLAQMSKTQVTQITTF